MFDILDSFLAESNDTDFMNISVNDNLDHEEKIIKETYNNEEESITENSLPSTTVGSYVLQNITEVKVNTEAFEGKESEDIFNIKDLK